MKFIYLILSVFILTISCKKENPPADNQDDTTDTTDTSVTTGLVLKPTIGLSGLPLSTDVICTIPIYDSDDFEGNAIPVDSLVNDFTLYNTTGTAFNLTSILEEGKPVLIVNGSYTCPVFRTNINKVNQLITDHGAEINTYVIYCVEAHPDIDVSPYSGEVWTTSQNESAGILYQQPTTYGERLDMVAALTDSMTLNCEILLDGPCNEFWLSFGEAPNRAYLIRADGTIAAMHGWFDYASMNTSIQTLLAE